MKNIFSKSLAFFGLALLLSCSNEDSQNTLNNLEGQGALRVEFDNSYAGNDLVLGAPNMVNSQGETLQVDQIKYIVSNIVLTNENGQAFTYPKASSYFIVSENSPASLFLDLSQIPAGNYTKIQFGIGVDEAQWAAGADGQGDLFTRADAQDMMWSWSAGYKFVLFEGRFTSAQVPSATPYMVHTGKTGIAYNYTDITLDLPQKALVRSGLTPEIHIVADLAKVLDDGNKVKLNDSNMGGMGAMIMGGAVLGAITQNVQNMFYIDHVHND